MSSLNPQIKDAIDSFDPNRARELLREAMKDANAETYFLASKVALDDDQKREFLEKAVALDPFHEKARAALKTPTIRSSPAPVMTDAIRGDTPGVQELGPGNVQTSVKPVSNEFINTFFRQIDYKLVKDTPSQLVFERAHKQSAGGMVKLQICKFEITLRNSETSITAHSRLIQSGTGNRFIDLAAAYELQKAELQDFNESAASGTPAAPNTIRVRAEFENAIEAKVERHQQIQNSPSAIIGAVILVVIFILFILWLSGGGLAVFF
ncbi:hypothetical protein FBR02_01685 [Anaerolineae bacterium CFX9]|nr:hypothetical protein [Anaerolineae bacterium CFX9]